MPPLKADSRCSDFRRTAKAAGRFWRDSIFGAALTASVYMAIALYTDSRTGSWPVSGARYYYEIQIFCKSLFKFYSIIIL